MVTPNATLALQRLVSWADELEELARMPGGERALAPLLRYVAEVSPDLQLEQFRAILAGRAPTAEAITMTIAEQLLAEGEARGEARGVAQGQLRRAVASVLTVLEARGLSVSPGDQTRIEGCQDLEVLQHWLMRAATATTVDGVFED